ncbi:Holliday junction branch migration protein RuvA [Dehalogenimonas sp. 4OHTPN]|uniref:Holliday junction branch migration complex subunit RuvA n=1 Tax=Dehalogenimonas sp. 4OHTPN TaxID=3166643 RepID=A0AAU8G7Z7_9CHLR
MIASLNGKIALLGADWAVIDVAGVGYKVFLTSAALSQIQNAKEVKLFTHLQVREDALTLFGFTTFEDLSIFETMLGVTGIGAKLALSLLSAFNAEELAAIIATGNEAMLCTVSGIGKKTASRIILELKDKVSRAWAAVPQSLAGTQDAEVLSALAALGYTQAEAARAVVGLPRDAALSVEEKIRLALAGLGTA